MTRDELNQKIASLESAAGSLDEPDRTLTTVKINNLKNEIDGMSLSDIADKMATIKTPTIADMDAKIKAAKDATAAQSMRVDAINSVIGLIKKGVGLVL
ncbi:hypothetical protein [Nisaea sp.]|uniref:hypothetical protein n=1 Tax=Nisaea sp. TaxID=2024842 RepID=UPI002B26C715|nr:hypothetical protein [Nisaea sp.]